MASRPRPGATRADADREVPAATGDCVEWRFRDGAFAAEPALLAVETPVAFEFNGIAHAVMLATPADLEDFALGFCLSEGILASSAELYGVDVCAGHGGITLQLEIASAAFAALKDRRRTLAGRTGCGICGTESLDQVLRPLRAVADPGWRLTSTALSQAAAALGGAQPLQQQTGATHAAAWCARDGSIVHLREDVGRHNALDKLIGALARAGVAPQEGFALITSRASVEMVQKAASASIPLLAAVSGPTTLAVQTAEALGVTLIGFTRGARFSVYTHRARVDAEPSGT
jgi:FdhD protein